MPRKKYNRIKFSSFDFDIGEFFCLPYSPTLNENPTLIEKLTEWLTNFRVIHDTIGFKLTISDLPRIKGSALIIDHPFTGSFERQAEYLKDYKGTTFCCDRALYKCLEYDFVPDYVVNVDSSYLCWGFFDRPEVRKVMDDVTAIFSNTTHPLTVRIWTGKRVFFTPASEPGLTEAMAAMSKTDALRTGGCVHNTCWSLAFTLGAKTIGLYGIDNSYEKLSQTEFPDVTHIKYYVEELDKEFYTDPVYEHYANILFNWMEIVQSHTKENKNKKIELVNATENGIMYSSVARQLGYEAEIKRMNLKTFIETYG